VTRGEIEQFVRGTLGCRCPAGVFDSIELRQLPGTTAAQPVVQLLIGERLLIQCVRPPQDAATPWIELLAVAGQEIRDRGGYKRFRLVVVGRHGTDLPLELEARFAAAVAGDDHAHLHLVTDDQLPDLLASPLADLSPAVAAAVTVAK
jgi:hypothetical protein